MQERSIQEFREKGREYAALGEKIYERYGEVEAILSAISGALDKGYSYSEIWAKVKTSGLPIADKILSLDYQGELRIRLDEEGPELELNANLTVPQNAQRYYDRAKEQTKKREGAEKALEETKKIIERRAAPEKVKTRKVARRRKPRWYERFRWFYSSDGFLVIGGRDASSNEEIYAKYLEKRDLALHTDAPGAPLTVIKTMGEEVPELTLEEAAQFAVSYSSVWKEGFFEGRVHQEGRLRHKGRAALLQECPRRRRRGDRGRPAHRRPRLGDQAEGRPGRRGRARRVQPRGSGEEDLSKLRREGGGQKVPQVRRLHRCDRELSAAGGISGEGVIFRAEASRIRTNLSQSSPFLTWRF
jgi:hypothetical protein